MQWTVGAGAAWRLSPTLHTTVTLPLCLLGVGGKAAFEGSGEEHWGPWAGLAAGPLHPSSWGRGVVTLAQWGLVILSFFAVLSGPRVRSDTVCLG